MWLEKLSLINFKNYTEAELDFSTGINAFTGDNGAGKTNVLDAIHYLSLCKSYFNPVDSQNIRQGEDLFVIHGTFHKDEVTETVYCGLKRSQKKQFKRNKKEYERLADHIGQFPLVMISPNDTSLVTEGSEERRRFIDNVISQTDRAYLDELISYNRALVNRNALLRDANSQGRMDDSLMEIYEDQLIDSGTRIFETRRAFMEEFTVDFNEQYKFLSGSVENVGLNYSSPLSSDTFPDILKRNRERDIYLERTSSGIHKDELGFSIHGMPLKKFGSQGQQKSFLIALKLAQYNYLKKQKGFVPILLLDDIFDKLDHSRITRLMQIVSAEDFGQIFITDTSFKRVLEIFAEIKTPVTIFKVDAGQIKRIENGQD